MKISQGNEKSYVKYARCSPLSYLLEPIYGTFDYYCTIADVISGFEE